MSHALIDVTKISSPSLKRLRMAMCYLYPSDSATCISTPSIVLLELDDLRVTTPLLEPMPLLETAFVRLGYSSPTRCKVRRSRYGCGLCADCIEFLFMKLGSLSDATYLELTAPVAKVHTISSFTFSSRFLLLSRYPVYRHQSSHTRFENICLQLCWYIYILS